MEIVDCATVTFSLFYSTMGKLHVFRVKGVESNRKASTRKSKAHRLLQHHHDVFPTLKPLTMFPFFYFSGRDPRPLS